jgi:hypothetical protein
LIAVKLTDSGDPMRFEVVISDGGGSSRHQVTASAADIARLAPPATTAEDIVEASFRFLLDREPKESILARFDLTVIARYFPDFEAKLPQYLARRP